MPPSEDDLGCMLRSYTLNYQSLQEPDMKTVEISADQLSHNVTELKPMDIYQFFLTANSKTAKSAYNATEIVALTKYVPGPVQNTSFSQSSSTQLIITWSAPAEMISNDEPFVNYTVETKLDQLGSCSKIPDEVQKDFIYNEIYKQAIINDVYPAAISVNSTTLTFVWDEVPCNMSNGQVFYKYTLKKLAVNRRKRSLDDDGFINGTTEDSNVTFTNLAPKTSYNFSVSAVNSAGEGPAISIDQATPEMERPLLLDPPTLIEINATFIKLVWNKWTFDYDKGGNSSNEPEYMVVYRLLDEGNWTDALENWQSDTSAVVTNLSANTQYEFAIRTRLNVSEDGDEAVGAKVIGRTAKNTISLELTSNIISPSTVKLSWKAPSVEDIGSEFTGYNLTYQSIKESEMGIKNIELTANQSSCIVNELKQYEIYQFNLSAVTVENSSIYIDSTLVNLANYVTGPVIGAAATQHLKHLNIKWSAPAELSVNEEKFVNYTAAVHLLQLGSCLRIPNNPNSHIAITTTKNQTSIPEIYPASRYEVRIHGNTAGGKGAVVNWTLSTLPAAPSGTVQNLRVTAAVATALTFEWDEVPCHMINGQLLYYKYSLMKSTDKRPKRDAESENEFRNGTILETKIKFDNLSPFTNYIFSISAVNVAGEGPTVGKEYSTSESETVSTNLTIVNATSTSLSFSIRLQNPITALVTDYQLDYSLNQETWESVTFSDDNVTIYNLNPYTNYFVKVRAKTSLGWSDWSVIYKYATDEGLPAEPENLKVKILSPTAIQVTWSNPKIDNGIIINYKIAVTAEVDDNETQSFDNLTYIKYTSENYSTKVEFSDLKPEFQYVVQVSASTSVGYGKNATQSIYLGDTTTIDFRRKPDGIIYISAPPTPTLVNKNSTTLTVTLYAHDKNFLYTPNQYLVAVSTLELTKVLNDTKDLRNYYEANATGEFHWIAADISNSNLSKGQSINFTIGDGQMYGRYYNGPLVEDKIFTVILKSEGKGFVSYWSSPMTTTGAEDGLAGKTSRNKECKIGVVSCVLFMIIVVAVVILFWLSVVVILLIRRRNRRKKLSITHGKANDGHPDNIWPKSSPNVMATAVNDTVLTVFPSSDVPSSTSKTFNKNANFYGPIAVKDLAEYIDQRAVNPKINFQEEFKLATRDKTKPWTVAKKPENQKKNRYGNILPYDMTRVRLEPLQNQPDTDYINASFVDGYDKPKVYIATQGPKENTFQDFWRMVWQENAAVIVMLTALTENKKKKCDQYWPSHSKLYGNILVTLSSTDNLADLIIRHFELKTVEGAEIRDVTLYQYIDWPDNSLPPCITSVLNLRRKVREEMQTRVSRSPIIVLCNGGSGRTGTFIAIDAILNQAYEEERVHVFKYVGIMWSNRSNLIQNADQYRFVYDAVLEALQSGDTRVICSRLPVYYKDITRESTNEPSDLEEQYNILNRLERRPSCYPCPEALNDENTRKNRTSEILPVEHSRVRLQSIYEPVFEDDESRDETDVSKYDPYINAVLCDGFKQKGQFLVTHMPLDETVQDFWRMVVLNRSSVIVMLNDCEFIDENTVPGQYWPNEGCMQYGPYQVEVVQFEELGMVTLRTLRVIDTRKIEDFIPLRVSQVQFLDWTPNKSIPTSTASVMSLINVADVLRNKYGGPLTVHCQNGASRCGVFCAAHIIHDQVDSGEVDVFQTIKRIRRHRPQFITSVEQYKFCYEFAVACLSATENSSKESKLVTLV
ncbi:hypothetical protein CHUAL_006334 [Chamberlinius hualienensis]